MMRVGFSLSILPLALLTLAACTDERAKEGPSTPSVDTSKEPTAAPPKVGEGATEPVSAAMVDPVPLWQGGKPGSTVDAAKAKEQGYLVVDLGEEFTPYLFSEGEDADGNPLPNAYRETYLALATESFPDNHHGDRASSDKYLELYGIMPTLSVLRGRFEAMDKLDCAKHLDLQPLVDFSDIVTYKSNNAAKRTAGDFIYLKRRADEIMRKQRVASAEEINEAKLDRRDRDILRRYRSQGPAYRAVDAMQQRLKCEGYFKGRGRFVKGAMDWATHDALAEFERRHRVYSWGYIGRDSLVALRMPALEAEREAVLRVLTERAIHAAGVIEDGSTSRKSGDTARTFKGMDGKDHPIPNFETDLRERVINAFGLQTPESTLAFLRGLGELPAGEHRRVAIPAPKMPEYYSGDMDLTLVYDRGDVWYDFPFDEEGNERRQPVSNRPRVTVLVKYNGQRIPLARFGTTIGGWRSEKVEDTVMWKYKGSPVGDRVWEQIVAAPVWLPPESTPFRDLLKRRAKRHAGEPKYEVNYHETGPSYASAYGLVAAYHRKYMKRADGTIAIGGDEGIRTHGSVDYMSIMRRHSHGCHRLHNHIAVRLMSFVLKHRPHRRVGQQPVAFFRDFEYDEEDYRMEIKQGGYIFQLETPLHVSVQEGRVRGDRTTPVEVAVPKFDQDVGAYLLPDGGAVALRGRELVSVPRPVLDAGVPMVPPSMVADTENRARPVVLDPMRQSLGLPQVKAPAARN